MCGRLRFLNAYEGILNLPQRENMAFQDKHSPSIRAKVLQSASILAGTLVSAVLTTGHADGLISLLKYERVGGNMLE